MLAPVNARDGLADEPPVVLAAMTGTVVVVVVEDVVVVVGLVEVVVEVGVVVVVVVLDVVVEALGVTVQHDEKVCGIPGAAATSPTEPADVEYA